MTRIFLPVGILMGLTALWGADGSVAGNNGTAIAEVDGTKLTIGDLERKNPTALFQALNTFYDAEKRAVDAYIDQYLLDRQAQKEHMTPEQLLEKHVNSTIAEDPSEESLRVYFEGVDTTQPYEVVRPQILEALRQRRLAKAKSAYLQSLRKDSNIAVLLVRSEE